MGEHRNSEHRTIGFFISNSVSNWGLDCLIFQKILAENCLIIAYLLKTQGPSYLPGYIFCPSSTSSSKVRPSSPWTRHYCYFSPFLSFFWRHTITITNVFSQFLKRKESAGWFFLPETSRLIWFLLHWFRLSRVKLINSNFPSMFSMFWNVLLNVFNWIFEGKDFAWRHSTTRAADFPQNP